jgi:hypothetical protein
MCQYPLREISREDTLPSEKVIESTRTCNIDITWSLHIVTDAHCVPGLVHASLIFT